MSWEEFVKIEEQKSYEARQKMQQLINEFGVPLDRLQELSQIDLKTIDPEILQQVELSLGMKISDIPVEKPKATASTYRQRGRGMAV